MAKTIFDYESSGEDELKPYQLQSHFQDFEDYKK